jgi:ABC-type glycerol-3-phosphate transport system substrate-binding protein
VQRVFLVSVFALAPLDAQAADLVVWWEKGFYPQEDEAVREIVAAFEQKTGSQVDLVLLDEEELPKTFAVALAASEPPDFGFGTLMGFTTKSAFGRRLRLVHFRQSQ